MLGGEVGMVWFACLALPYLALPCLVLSYLNTGY